MQLSLQTAAQTEKVFQQLSDEIFDRFFESDEIQLECIRYIVSIGADNPQSKATAFEKLLAFFKERIYPLLKQKACFDLSQVDLVYTEGMIEAVAGQISLYLITDCQPAILRDDAPT